MIPISQPRCWTGRRHRSKAADSTAVTLGRALPSGSGKSALDAQARLIAKRLPQNIAVEQRRTLFGVFGNFSPDSHERQPGLLAYLQEARATKVFLIKRNDNHGSYLARQFVKSSLRSPPCRFVAVLAARFIFPDIRLFCRRQSIASIFSGDGLVPARRGR
jgi:hypothetical protein